MATKVNWELLKADYATGAFKDGALSAKYGVSREQIARRRSADRKQDPNAWPKDLADAVERVTKAKLSQTIEAISEVDPSGIRSTVSGMVAEAVNGQAREFTEVILAAAEVNKQVIMGHRQDAANLRRLVGSLTNEIVMSNLLADDMDLLAQIVAGEGAQPADDAKARATVMKALGMGQRVSSLKALSETLKNLIAIEREAYNIAPNDGKPQDAQTLSDDELARKLARFGITGPH